MHQSQVYELNTPIWFGIDWLNNILKLQTNNNSSIHAINVGLPHLRWKGKSNPISYTSFPIPNVTLLLQLIRLCMHVQKYMIDELIWLQTFKRQIVNCVYVHPLPMMPFCQSLKYLTRKQIYFNFNCTHNNKVFIVIVGYSITVSAWWLWLCMLHWWK